MAILARRALASGRALAGRARKLARGHGRTAISDLLFLAGGAIAVHGMFLVWRPLGVLAAGALLAAVGLVLAPAAKKRRPQQ